MMKANRGYGGFGTRASVLLGVALSCATPTLAAENFLLRLQTFNDPVAVRSRYDVPPQGPAVGSTNLPDIVVTAIKNSPRIKAAKLNRKAAAKDVWAAKGQFLPVISAQGNVTLTHNEYSLGATGRTDEGHLERLGLSARMPLFPTSGRRLQSDCGRGTVHCAVRRRHAARHSENRRASERHGEGVSDEIVQ